MKVQLLDLEGSPLGSFDSLRKAALATETNHMKLSRYAKSIDTVFIEYLGIEVEVFCKGFVKEGRVIHPSAKIHPPLSHDLVLSPGKICVIDQKISKVIHTYSTMYEAASALEIRFIEIKRYIGTNYLVPTPKGSFYFDADLETLIAISTRLPLESKPLDVTDLNTGIVTTYKSVTQASKTLKIHHDFILKHMDMKSVFISKDGLRRYKFTSLPLSASAA